MRMLESGRIPCSPRRRYGAHRDGRSHPRGVGLTSATAPTCSSSFATRHCGNRWQDLANSTVVLSPTRRLTLYIDHLYIERMAIREPTFYILTALARGSLHGYGIMSAVDELSDATVKL